MGPATAGDWKSAALSCIKARPIALGGAFTALHDGLPALDFNPASFSLDRWAPGGNAALVLNPAGPLLLLRNCRTIDTWTQPVAYLFRGLGFRWNRIQAGFLFGEESLGDARREKRRDPFDGHGFQMEVQTAVGFSFMLAPRVSLGAAAECFVREGNWREARLGYRYGLHLHPRQNLSVGMCYFDFPDRYGSRRMELERLADATLNIGAAYEPVPWMTLALDVRNVSDEGKNVVREPHAGIEVTPLRHLSLRSGLSRDWIEKQNVFSFGIGLLDPRALRDSEGPPSPQRMVVNLTVVLKQKDAGTEGWFLLTSTVAL
jgi:hypothetical protein